MRVLTARCKDDEEAYGEFAPRHLPPPNLLKDDSSRMIIKIFTGDYARGFVSAHLHTVSFTRLSLASGQDASTDFDDAKNMQLLCAFWGVRKTIV